jgi:hypothetical protein
VFCACGIIQLFCVVFCVVRAVHKFGFRLVVEENPNKWRGVFFKNLRDAVIETHVLDTIYRFSSDLRREYQGPLPTL